MVARQSSSGGARGSSAQLAPTRLRARLRARLRRRPHRRRRLTAFPLPLPRARRRARSARTAVECAAAAVRLRELLLRGVCGCVDCCCVDCCCGACCCVGLLPRGRWSVDCRSSACCCVGLPVRRLLLRRALLFAACCSQLAVDRLRCDCLAGSCGAAAIANFDIAGDCAVVGDSPNLAELSAISGDWQDGIASNKDACRSCRDHHMPALALSFTCPRRSALSFGCRVALLDLGCMHPEARMDHQIDLV
jgi:hypothetical protein